MARLMAPIVIDGDLNQRQLDQLRAQLGLPRRGRLDDSEDVDYGTRWLHKEDHRWVTLSLERDDADGWRSGYCSEPIFRFTLDYYGDETPPLSAEMVEYWRAEILRAIQDAGLRVAN